MNLAVADKLRRYDTDGVAEILAANKGKVDENLLEAFSAIQHNLQEYRPHIPDYVIAATTEDPTMGDAADLRGCGDDDDEGDLQISLVNFTNSPTVSDSSISNHAAQTSISDMKYIHMDGSGGHRPNEVLTQGDSMLFTPPPMSIDEVLIPPPTGGVNNNSHLPSTTTDTTRLAPGTVSGRSAGSSGDCRHPDFSGFQSGVREEDSYVAGGTASSGLKRTSLNTVPATRYNRHELQGQTRHELQGQTRHELQGRHEQTCGISKQLGDDTAMHLSKNTTKRSSTTCLESSLIEYSEKSRHHYYGRATTVFVRIVSTTCGSDGSGSGFVSKSSAVSAMNILSKCVDAGSKLAKAHGGALQYMQGCGLMVSFNAASRSAAHESKACAFALGLKAAVDDMLDATIVMHASIVTTNVLSFFAGNSGQLMLTVLGGFMPQHTAMQHYLSQTVGKEASCVLLSDTVVPAIEMLYEHRLLGASALISNYSDTPLVIALSQLVSSVRDKGDDDKEWMYKLAQGQLKSPLERELGALIQRVVYIQITEGVVGGSCNGSDTSTGRTELIQRGTIQALLPQCDVNDTVLERCVKERLLAFTTTTTATNDEDGGGFIVNAAPITMW